ncbi:MAG: non-ribosomal peptide synthetase [Reyranella sp.]
MVGWRPGAAVPAAQRGDDDFGLEAIGETVTKRFAASVQATASAVAVVQGVESLTYADLDRRSTQLARFLHRQGVRAGSVVALHAGRSIASVVAILATLKTGAAYMPLNPTAPIAYHDWILRDCGADMVLSASDRIAEFSVLTLNLEETLAAAESEPAAALEISCGPADIACIMYTSGSTGRPKGVLIPHRAVVRLVIGQTYARFGADEVFLHNAPLAFDASTFEIWGTLLHGARGVLIEDDRASLQSIVDTIREHRVTTAWFTARLFNALVDHQLDALGGLRQILAGGDVLSPTHVLRAQAAHPDCQLINGYGPTENTTFTCCYRIPREGWGGGPVPIGVPICGTYVRLLDDDMKPVAEGEVGMLYTGGLGLASGYLGDARHSAMQFVADPLHGGATLYQTGDFARRRADGNLDFIGRRDRQIKIDGKRVELSEIEEAMRRSNGVADAVVTAVRNEAGAALLTAYIKPASSVHDRAALVMEARARLLRALPPHMQPSQVVVLDEFPLTQNGKIDQERLPVRRLSEAPPARYATGKTAGILSGIFARTLGLRDIGQDTNFFDLGATSLKLVEAHALIALIWPSIDVLALFQHPNIRELSQAIEGRAASGQSAGQRGVQQQAAALRRLRTSRRAE